VPRSISFIEHGKNGLALLVPRRSTDPDHAILVEDLGMDVEALRDRKQSLLLG
jgi:hypothetical protein